MSKACVVNMIILCTCILLSKLVKRRENEPCAVASSLCEGYKKNLH